MNKQKAFTLIELMVTVAIMGILASIAYPSYQDSVIKSRRADIKGVLLGLANTMERHYTETNPNTYVGVTSPAADAYPYYSVTIHEATASIYTLWAAPRGAQNDAKCGTLTLNHLGVKGVTGATSGVTAADCW